MESSQTKIINFLLYLLGNMFRFLELLRILFSLEHNEAGEDTLTLWVMKKFIASTGPLDLIVRGSDWSLRIVERMTVVESKELYPCLLKGEIIFEDTSLASMGCAIVSYRLPSGRPLAVRSLNNIKIVHSGWGTDSKLSRGPMVNGPGGYGLVLRFLYTGYILLMLVDCPVPLPWFRHSKYGVLPYGRTLSNSEQGLYLHQLRRSWCLLSRLGYFQPGARPAA